MTTFTSPLRVGTNRDGFGVIAFPAGAPVGSVAQLPQSCNIGGVQLVQQATLNFSAALVQEVVFNIPANSSIQNFWIDTLTAFDSTTNSLTIGTATAGTQYQTGVDVKTTGRETQTFTAAPLLAMSSVGTNLSVFVTITGTGANPTVGKVFVTMAYTTPLT